MYQSILKPEKIKSISYLVNKIKEKEETFNIPKHCFFLGSGCSVSSDIPTGFGVTDLCKNFSFVNNHSDASSIDGNIINNFNEFTKTVQKFVEARKNEFSEYVIQKEEIFKASITSEEINKLVPENIIKFISLNEGLTGENLSKHIYNVFLEDFANDFAYGKWFEEFSQDTRRRQKLIENIIEDKNPSGEYILFANLINQGLINDVFTTNFDDLLNETLLVYLNKKSRVYSHNELARYITIGSKKPNIIKLHGDYLFEDIKNINEETTELFPNMQAKFKEALGYLDMVVIGYRGADYSIMSILENLKKERTFGLIWCGKDSTKLHWRVINLINNTPNSFFVQVDDFKTLVFKLWNISQELPENLIAVAEKKQEELYSILEEFNVSIEANHSLTNEEKRQFDVTLKATEIANIAFKEKDNFKKIELYTQSLELDKSPIIYNNRGAAYQNVRQINNAIKDFTRALEIKNDYSLPYFNRAQCKRDLNDFLGALDDYNRAIKLDSSYTKAYAGRALTYLKLGFIKEYNDDINYALKLDPADAETHSVKGYALQEMGEYELALNSFDNALKFNINPKAATYNNMAVAYRRLKKFDKAIEYATKALNDDPEYSFAYGTLALTYGDLADDVKFYEFLNKCLEKNCPAWEYLEDDAFNKYRNSKKLKNILQEYKKKYYKSNL